MMCLEHCSVAFSLSCSTLLPYEYTSENQNTSQIAWFRCCLKLCVHWTWNQEGLLSDRTVPNFMHFAQKTDTKVWIIQNVHNSFSCTVVPMKHVQCGSACTIVSPFVHHIPLPKRNQKHPRYAIFRVLSVPVCRARPTKIRMSESQLYPKLRRIHKKWRLHDTPVQLIQNVHRFDSCAIGQIMLHSTALFPYSRKTRNMVKTKVSAVFASLCTKDLEQRWAATWSNAKESYVPRVLFCCL